MLIKLNLKIIYILNSNIKFANLKSHIDFEIAECTASQQRHKSK